MQKLLRDDLYNLEMYAAMRVQFRKQIMAHKKNRQVPIGPHVTLYFEDQLTIKYQVQEMLTSVRFMKLWPLPFLVQRYLLNRVIIMSRSL